MSFAIRIVFLCFFFLATNLCFGQVKKGYIVILGCCFKQDSIIIKSQKQIYFAGKVNTESTTSIDIKTSLFIEVKKSKKFKIISGSKKIKTVLEKPDTLKFLYVYFYRDSLYTQITEQVLKAE